MAHLLLEKFAEMLWTGASKQEATGQMPTELTKKLLAGVLMGLRKLPTGYFENALRSCPLGC